MKINESTLAAFATSSETPPDKEGWLWKRGEVNRAYQRRYFVLKGNLLFYSEKKLDREPIGLIILEGCSIDLAEEDSDKYGFKISFNGQKGRVYHLGTDSQETLEEWMKLLACASHDYMKLMVRELEQQLQELGSTSGGNLENGIEFSEGHFSSARDDKDASMVLAEEDKCTVKSGGSSRPGRVNPFVSQQPFHEPGFLEDFDPLSTEDEFIKKQHQTAIQHFYQSNAWKSCHAKYGEKILLDRDSWLVSKGILSIQPP